MCRASTSECQQGLVALLTFMSNKFTVKDLPMINRHGLRRWSELDDGVKHDVIDLIRTTLRDDTAKYDDKLKAASLVVRIDNLNLKHEQFYTPKMDLDVSSLTDEELEQQIHQLEEQEREEEIYEQLTTLSNEEILEHVEPMLECEQHTELSPVNRTLYTNKII